MNAWLHLALPCVERAEQVSSEMSGRKESSEIMTGAPHNVKKGRGRKKIIKEENDWEREMKNVLYTLCKRG